MTTLVVGANGQLGSRLCADLLARGDAVRGTVRNPERGRGLSASGVEVVTLDLARKEGFAAALDGVDAMFVTANPVAPRRGDDPGAVEQGLSELMRATEDRRGLRVVLVSVPQTDMDRVSSLFRARRRLEAQVLGSTSYEATVVRFAPFMESWLALVGSSLPLRGEPYATIGRPSPFLRAFRKVTGSLIEDHGLMLVPGSADNQNAFISVADAARACLQAMAEGRSGATYEVGGPEVLRWAEVAERFGEVLGRRVRVIATPAPVYAAAAAAMAPIAKVPAATMALNRVMATTETNWAQAHDSPLVDTQMTTVRDFLLEKAALPPRLPTVP